MLVDLVFFVLAMLWEIFIEVIISAVLQAIWSVGEMLVDFAKAAMHRWARPT